MNAITNNFRITGAAIAIFTIVVFGFGFATKAYASDDGIDSSDFYPVDTSSGVDSSDFYPTDTSSGVDSSDFYPADSSGVDSYDFYPASTPASYYASTPSSYYSSPSYFTGGSSFGGTTGFSNPGYPIGGSSSTYAPTNVSSSVYAPSNTCTGGNVCNTTISTPTTVTIDNNQPVYQQQQQPIVYSTPCSTCNCYGPCAVNTVIPTAPVYPTPAPYVSLTAVPYTGLDLGPVGTVLYWSFLVLWCLAAAYLIVVKRVQNKVVSGLNHFLFGVSTPAPLATAGSRHIVHATHAHATHATPTAPKNEDTIDPFIVSQINRAK